MVDPLVSMFGVETGDMIGHKRFLALFAGGMLPIISLSFLHMLVKFEEEEKNIITPKVPEDINLIVEKVDNTNIDIDELSIAAGKKEAEIEKEKYTPTDIDLEELDKQLRRMNELRFGNLEDENSSEEPEIKRLSYLKRDA